jgi:MOSC domain-containing protein YiiM
MPSVVKIYLRPSSRTPVKAVAGVNAVAGKGLQGDHAGGGNRQVTLMAIEAWQAACRDLGSTDLDPGGRRANIVIEGLSLRDRQGLRLRVGDAVVEIVRHNPPCRLMDDFAPGLQRALASDYRSGVYGRIVQGGRIDVGSPVSLVSGDAGK